MKKTQKGFTIIEVALVLAVGAMIFLVVFLAVPALQRNSRNDGRKRDASNVVTAIETYASNNPTTPLANQVAYKGGKSDTSTTLGKYLDTQSSYTETIQVMDGSSTTTIGEDLTTDENRKSTGTRPTKIIVYTSAQCVGNSQVEKASTRSAAVVYGVETAAGYDYQCMDAN